MTAVYPWLRIDNMVELGPDAHGYKGSWFLVKITELRFTASNRCNEVQVEYPDFFETDEPGSTLLREFVKPTLLRPLCPNRQEDVLQETYRPRRRQLGDVVEAQHNGAWWNGYIKATMYRDNEYIVAFEHGYDDLRVPGEEIRTRWNYMRVEGGRQWQWVKA